MAVGIEAVFAARSEEAARDFFERFALRTLSRSTEKLSRGLVSPSVVAEPDTDSVDPRKPLEILSVNRSLFVAFDASDPIVNVTCRPRLPDLPPRAHFVPFGRSTVTAMPRAGARPPLRTDTLY